jgi:predicted glycosyltransferase
MIKVALYINHPSQFYFFRLLTDSLKRRNIDSQIFVREKEILGCLLSRSGLTYKTVGTTKGDNRMTGLISSVFRKNIMLIRELKKYKPDFLISCGSDVAQAGFCLGIPRFVLNDDDAKVVPLSAIFGWPFASLIFAPEACNMGFWRRKTIAYKGYFKAGYLHPAYFKPDPKILSKYGLEEGKYFLIRSVSLTAHHDRNIRGLNNELVGQLVSELSLKGKVFISSERELPSHLNSFRLQIDPADMHHILSFASLLISDSQSMTHEAALLGTPSVRFNDFYDKVGVLNELESKYDLTYGISPDKPDQLFEKVGILTGLSDKCSYRGRASTLLSESTDLPELIAWFVSNYPQSRVILTSYPKNMINFSFRNKPRF